MLVMRENRNVFPSQLLGVGASVQVLKSNSLFHEVSLTKLSSSKSSYTVNFTTTDSVGARSTFQLGYEQKASAFGFRYEVGKYFGDPKRANLRFGISGGIERTYNIKAFCFHQVMDKYDPRIRESLFSAFIGEHIEKEELFEFAAIEGASNFFYTRDGNYPPESDDGAVVEMETIASLQGILGTGLIQSELRELTGEKRKSMFGGRVWR